MMLSHFWSYEGFCVELPSIASSNIIHMNLTTSGKKSPPIHDLEYQHDLVWATLKNPYDIPLYRWFIVP